MRAPLSKKRAQITSKDIDEWFASYKKFIHEVGLEDRPAQIWNCDESGFDLQGRAGKVIGPFGIKDQPYRVIVGTKEHITVLPCYSATGQCLPPYILYSGKRPPTKYNLLEGGVPGSSFSLTENGYMTAPTFYMWLANHFIPNIPPARPVVLLIDSAECHLDLETFELAKKHSIHIYALLKNATHLVQPADVGLFAAMKQSWYKNVRTYSRENPNSDSNKKNFSFIFKNTWYEVMRPSLLIDSFRKSGIYPLNRQQLTDDQVRTSIVYSSSESNVAVPTENAPSSSMSRSDAAEVLASLANTSTCPDIGSSSSHAIPQVADNNLSPRLTCNKNQGVLTKLALESIEKNSPDPGQEQVQASYTRTI